MNYRHALKNTLVPVITIIGLQFGNIFAFSIIVETVFQWPGLGLLVIQSIQFADVPLLAAYLVMIALGFAVLNLAVDLLYAAIDPRVRTGMSRRGRAHERGCHRSGRARWWDSDLAYDFRRSPVAISPGRDDHADRRGDRRRCPRALQRQRSGERERRSTRACRPAPRACLAATYLLGTDPQGRDMLSAVIFGLRTSLLVGGLSVAARGAASASFSACSAAISAAGSTPQSCASPTSS